MTATTDAHLVAPAARNTAAARTFAYLTEAVATENAEGLIPAPSFAAYQAASTALLQSAVAVAALGKVGDRVVTPDGELVIAESASDTRLVHVLLTEDGKGRVAGWHNNPEALSGQVRYEAWQITDEAGSGFPVALYSRTHGYLDPSSRMVVQTG